MVQFEWSITLKESEECGESCVLCGKLSFLLRKVVLETVCDHFLRVKTEFLVENFMLKTMETIKMRLDAAKVVKNSSFGGDTVSD